MILKIVIFTMSLLVLTNVTKAQTPDDLNKMYNFFEIKNNKTNWNKKIQKTSNEIEFSFTALFIFYKKFISSQDSRKCSFYPSCSAYGIETIMTNGVIYGIMDTFDRLTRCNGLSPEQYPYLRDIHKLSDPVTRHNH